jgi:hypothetical protein
MTVIQRVRRAAIAAAVTLVLPACGDDSDESPTGNEPGIDISANPSVIEVNQGASGTIEITLTRSGGFTGAVALSAKDLPIGVTVGIDPPQLVGSALHATVTFTVATSVTAGAYTGSIEASAMAMRAAVAVKLTVTEAPDLALTVSAPLTIPAGGTASAEVQLTRTNLTAPISLSLLNPPAGITATFNPASATANTSTMTVSVAANVTPGNHQATIQATATGLGTETFPLPLIVVPAPPAGTNVSYYFCNVDDLPAFLAYQDGAGSWQAVSGVTSGSTTTYSFNIAQGRGAVLSTYPYSLSGVRGSFRAQKPGRGTWPSRLASPQLAVSGADARLGARTQAAVGDAYDTYVVFGSTSELARDGLDACAQDPPTKTVQGTVQGVAAGQYGVASLGSSTNIFDGAASTNPFTFHDVPSGVVDLVGSRIVTPGQAPDRLILVRNLNVPDGGTLPQPINYNGPASLVPVVATATIAGSVSGDQNEIYVDLITLNGSSRIWSDLAPSATSTRPWAGFNSANMVAGDMHRIWAFASRGAGTGLPVFRVATRTVGPVANQTLTLGAELAAPTSTMAAGGIYPRFRFQGAIPGDYTKGVFIDLFGEDDGSNAYYFFASGAYLTASGSAGAYNLTMPDLTALPGFPVDSRLSAGVNIVTVAVQEFTGPGIYEARRTLGAETKEAYKTITIVVP